MTSEEDVPRASPDAMRAAFLLMRSRAGEVIDETELHALVAAGGGPAEVTRGAAVLIGAVGRYVVDRLPPDDAEIDAPALVASGLRRIERAGIVAPAVVPLAAGMLTAALVARVDTLGWLDDIGPRDVHAVALIEVLAHLADLVDAIHDKEGVANSIIGSVFDGRTDDQHC